MQSEEQVWICVQLNRNLINQELLCCLAAWPSLNVLCKHLQSAHWQAVDQGLLLDYVCFCQYPSCICSGTNRSGRKMTI